MASGTAKFVYSLFYLLYLTGIILLIVDVVHFYQNSFDPEFAGLFFQNILDQGPIYVWSAYILMYLFSFWIAYMIFMAGLSANKHNAGPAFFSALVILILLLLLASFDASRGLLLFFISFFTIYFNSISTGIEGYQKGKQRSKKRFLAPLIAIGTIIYEIYQSNNAAAHDDNPNWLNNYLSQYFPYPNVVLLILAIYLIFGFAKTTYDTFTGSRKNFSKIRIIYNIPFLIIFTLSVTVINPMLPLQWYEIELAIFMLIGFIVGATGDNR